MKTPNGVELTDDPSGGLLLLHYYIFTLSALDLIGPYLNDPCGGGELLPLGVDEDHARGGRLLSHHLRPR